MNKVDLKTYKRYLVDIMILEGTPYDLGGFGGGGDDGLTKKWRKQCRRNQRWCWLTNTAYNNETSKLELYGFRESPCSSSLKKAHPVRKSHPDLSD